ncbi:MAG: FAD-binding protein [Phycisphaerales bacterium]|nr:MAG: FAD-binding protein [Phycisphaerales bacterium]
MIFGLYTRWLHAGWPAGPVEKLPEVNEDGTRAVPALLIVGELTGIPLLSFSAGGGVGAIRAILQQPDCGKNGTTGDEDLLDVAIIGAGVSGISAAIEARKAGLRFAVFQVLNGSHPPCQASTTRLAAAFAWLSSALGGSSAGEHRVRKLKRRW